MQSHRRTCNGHRKDGSPCEGPAVTGADKCRMHLGKKAGAVLAEARARQLVETYGRKIETTAVDALLDEVQWTAGHVAWLRQRVQEIETGESVEGEQPLVWGVTKRKTGGDDRGVTEEAAPNIWLRLYQTERTHLVKVCAEAIRAGIEERRVRLAEQQGALVADVIRQILGDLNLSAEQEARVADVVPFRLRALAG